MAMKTALVTGAAGFLGSHVCEALVADGWEVIGMDNLITGRLSNLDGLAAEAHFRFVRHNVSDFVHVPGRLDAVLHMASPASPQDYLDNPIATLKVGALGTHNTLGLAKDKGARYLLASTSEVYGDPLVSPQPESYWGNVNPVGPRGVYDEAKRFAEAIAMAYHREHRVDVKIIRIFNSILADENVLYDDGCELRLEPVGDLARRLGQTGDLRGYSVPAFGSDGHMAAAEATALVGHPPTGPCFEVRTDYGRTIRVTGDHSLFVSRAGGPEARPVSELQVGDRVGIAGRVVVPERDRSEFRMTDVVDGAGLDPWSVLVKGPGLGTVAWSRRHELFAVIDAAMATSPVARRNAIWTMVRRCRDGDQLHLAALRHLGVAIPEGAVVRLRTASRAAELPAAVVLTDELLWLLGLYLAEGRLYDKPPENGFITISGDEARLDRAAKIVERDLNLHVVRAPSSVARGASLFIHSRLLLRLFDHIGLGAGPQRIPGWVLGLPLTRLKRFLEGYREGDSVHSGPKFEAGNRHEFRTASTALKDSLLVALGRFGLVPSIGRYETTFRPRTGDRSHPFWRVTIPDVTPWSPLEWDRGVTQRLRAPRTGELVWARVRSITEVPPTDLVYDFCVPGYENFLAGGAVMAHNTYGPRLRPGDGRVVSNFLVQALRREPLTIYGDGSQTRSFCFVSDEVDGILRLLESDHNGPMNIGNPGERTVLDLAQQVLAVTGSSSPIEHRDLPEDDPKRRRPDIALARQVLGWEPRVDLEEGLRVTARWLGRELAPAAVQTD